MRSNLFDMICNIDEVVFVILADFFFCRTKFAIYLFKSSFKTPKVKKKNLFIDTSLKKTESNDSVVALRCF